MYIGDLVCVCVCVIQVPKRSDFLKNKGAIKSNPHKLLDSS